MEVLLKSPSGCIKLTAPIYKEPEEVLEIPEEALTITGNCKYRFANNGWNWFIEACGDKIKTEKISNAENMFADSSKLEELPFDINFIDGGGDIYNMFNNCSNIVSIPSIDFKHTTYKDASNLFNNCYKLEEIGTIKNLYPASLKNIFYNCNKLKQLPKFENLQLDRIHSYKYADISNMFYYCNSLRSIPEELLKELYNELATTSSYLFYTNAFTNCIVLDEIRGISPKSANLTSNVFSGTFKQLNRVKNITFDIDNGKPYIVNWKSQTIDLSSYGGQRVGYGDYASSFIGFGLTADKEVKDDATYKALKNDPDWFTTKLEYSRYNHDSAVNTINSLPDASEYLATAGGTNIIKFEGAAGSKTDGGAINTLTEAEIAVAAAKGWTVIFR